MARELPMFDPTPGHASPPAHEISIAVGAGATFGPSADGSLPVRRHPDWIKARMPSGDNYHELKGLLSGLNLNTVHTALDDGSFDRGGRGLGFELPDRGAGGGFQLGRRRL